MSASTHSKLILAGMAAVCLVALVLTSCSEKATGSRRPNIAPETFIAFGPAEDSLTYYKVQVFWYGADEDGSIDHFLVTTVQDVDRTAFPAGWDWDSIGGWQATSSKESTFVLTADSCCIRRGDVRSALSPWGILVRAVDNDGQASEEPAMLFFKANNVLPKVILDVPPQTSGPNDLTAHPYFEWRGVDDDGDAAALQYKYIVIPVADLKPQIPRLPDLSYEDSSGTYACPPVGKWSQWVPSDCTSVRDMDLELYKPQAGVPTKFLRFYVTARDEGGALLPETLYGPYNGEDNWREFFVISTGTGVQITIDGGQLGQRVSTDAGHSAVISGIFTGTQISFRFWTFEQKSQGKIADAFRYYWDSPSDPMSSWNFWTGVTPLRVQGATPEWSVRLPTDGGTFEPALGGHLLYVEVRDVNMTTTRCLFKLDVLPGPARLTTKKIVFVDDDEARWLDPSWQGFEAASDAFWDDVLAGYNLEIIDTGYNHSQREVDIRLVNSASTVIWSVDDVYNQPDTYLYELAALKGNYLYSYVKVGGNLIIVGKDPVGSMMYWPDGRIWSGNNTEGGGDMRVPKLPTERESMQSWDFTPLGPSMTESGDSVFNWNWDIFGIKRMQFPTTPTRPLNALVSCSACDPAFADTIMTIEPPVRGFSGDFGNAAYITELRTDMDVRPLFTGGYYDSTTGHWQIYGNNFLTAIYVPPTAERGGVAYIGVPVYWFDHDKIKTLIRHLLAEFGEQPLGS
jgi:hypothetical protein